MSTPSDPIEDLLAQLKTSPPSFSPPLPPSSQSPSSQSSPPPQRPLSDLLSELNTLKTPPPHSPTPQSPTPQSPETDRLLTELKSLHRDRLQAEVEAEAREIAATKRHQETLERQRQAAIARRAETWLTELKPDSGETAWFDEFAAKYESRLEAAIDYLGALEDS